MEDTSFDFPILPILAFVALFVGLLTYALRRAKQRRQALRAVAERLGLSFVEGGAAWTAGPGARLLARFAGFHPFGRGDRPGIKNLVFGTRDGVDWTSFDYWYQYETPSAENDTSVSVETHGVAAVRVPLALPTVSIEPRTLLRKLGALVEGVPEVATGSPAFDEAYLVRSSSRELALELLTPAMGAYLLGMTPRAWQFQASSIVVTVRGEHTPDDVVTLHREMLGLLAQIPPAYRQARAVRVSWASALD